MKVLVVTNSAFLKRELLCILNGMPNSELVVEAEEPKIALRLLSTIEPDLVLAEKCCADNDARELFNQITRHLPLCKVIVVSKNPNLQSSWDLTEKRVVLTPGKKYIEAATGHDYADILAYIKQSLAERARSRSESVTAQTHDSPQYLYGSAASTSPEQQENNFAGLAGVISERRRQSLGRRHSEIVLQESASRFQSLIEQLPAVLYIANLDSFGSTVYVGSQIEHLLGFSAEHWRRDPELRIRQLHSGDRDRVLMAIRQAIERKGALNIDYRIHRCDGTVRWFHEEARIITSRQGEPLFLQGVITDMTDSKQAQDELARTHHELQDLITSLDAMRVEEEKRLAHEMHDDFGQLLAAMKMDISSLQRCLPLSDSRVVRHLSSINELVDTMVASVRRIVADLPPRLLEDVGLYSALEFMLESFEKRYGVTSWRQFSQPEPILEPRFSTAIYRIVQETLNNVAKHAHATLVEVKMHCSPTHMELSVRDDGQGLAPDHLRKRGSFGLTGMRERVAALNGEMWINSAEGAGTTVQIAIPLRARAPSDPSL